MSETTPEEYRKAMRYQYSKQGEDVGVVGILDELEQAYVERDSLKEQMQEWMEGSAQLQVKLDEAVRLLDLCRVHLPIEGPQGELRKDVVAFIPSLSTVTAE